MAAQAHGMREVRGSNPLRSTKVDMKKKLARRFAPHLANRQGNSTDFETEPRACLPRGGGSQIKFVLRFAQEPMENYIKLSV